MNKLAISETSVMYQNRKVANDITSERTRPQHVVAQGKTQSGRPV